MNPSPLAILLIIAIGAAVFGGIVFFGLRPAAPLASPPTWSTLSRIPDILNLPGFGSRPQVNPSQAPVSSGSGPSGAGNPDIVVEKSELPSPSIPLASTPSQLSGPKIQAPTPSRISTPVFIPTPQAPPIPQPLPPPRQLLQASAAASFSIFTASPQLRDFRTQMVREGVIKDTEFVKINNNGDMEQFLLKLVEWQARKAGSTDAQIQDALDRIKKAYDQVKR